MSGPPAFPDPFEFFRDCVSERWHPRCLMMVMAAGDDDSFRDAATAAPGELVGGRYRVES